MRALAVVFAIVSAQTVFAAPAKFDWLTPPVRMKPIKEQAEGYFSEGFDVTDKENRYTVICRVSNGGIPTITEWKGSMRIEEIDKDPRHYLRSPGDFSELKLKWAEACRRMFK